MNAIPRRVLSSRFVRMLVPALVLGPATLGLATEAAKPYTLFLGTDFSVQQNKEYHRVHDVSGGNFIIKIGDKEVAVPMRAGSGTLKIDQGFKLSGSAAHIEKLKTERAYTPENDPNRKFASRASGALAANDSQQLAVMRAEDANRRALGAANARTGAGLAGADAATMNQLGSAADSAAFAAGVADQNVDSAAYVTAHSEQFNAGFAAFELQQELAAENFDAMRYSFELSSETPLGRPYLVFIVRYHEKDAKPGTSQGQVIYAKPIEPVGPHPSKINILQTGMPIGFVVDECQVRLYNNGQEVATNIAPRRMEMTKDEAFLYLKIDRVGRAKGATLPAAPAIGRPDEATRARLTNDQLRSPYFVKVTKEGRADGVFIDQDCTKPADETISALVQEMRFYPALENGKEQPGIARLVLPQVPI